MAIEALSWNEMVYQTVRLSEKVYTLCERVRVLRYKNNACIVTFMFGGRKNLPLRSATTNGTPVHPPDDKEGVWEILYFSFRASQVYNI